MSATACSPLATRSGATAVPRRARLHRRRRRSDLPVAALRRAGDAVRAAARHGDELPLGATGRARPASSSRPAQVLRVGVALLGLRITLGAGRRARLAAGRAGRRLDRADDRRCRCSPPAPGLQHPVRLPERRRHGDLRRFGGAGARRGVARASAEGARDAVHGDRRLGAVDRGDDRLPDARAARSASTRSRPASSSARTIHDVAQVVGAGYSVSQETGDVATLVKLMRVAMLLPVIVVAVMLTRAPRRRRSAGKRPPLLPWFAVAFAVLVAVNSTGWLAAARAGARQRRCRAGAWWRRSRRSA